MLVLVLVARGCVGAVVAIAISGTNSLQACNNPLDNNSAEPDRVLRINARRVNILREVFLTEQI